MIEKIIISIESSNSSFRNKLKEIDEHFYHLKQELHIRDALVKELNTELLPLQYRAYAERPRETVNRTTRRRDVGVYKFAKHLPVGNSKFNIELKYHYYRDLFNKNSKNHGEKNTDIQSLNEDWKRTFPVVLDEPKRPDDSKDTDLFLLVLCRRPWGDNKFFAARDREFSGELPDALGKDSDAINALAQEISKNHAKKSAKDKFSIDHSVRIKNGERETDYRFLGLFRS